MTLTGTPIPTHLRPSGLPFRFCALWNFEGRIFTWGAAFCTAAKSLVGLRHASGSAFASPGVVKEARYALYASHLLNTRVPVVPPTSSTPAPTAIATFAFVHAISFKVPFTRVK